MNLNQNIIKKTYIFFISFLFIFFSCNSDDDHNVAVTSTLDDFVINFKDLNFKNAVKSYYNITANDVTYGDVKDKIKLNVWIKRITNMEEIRYFDSLRALDCSSNKLTSLDLSQNTYLEYLDCSSNKLTSLDISQNTVLKTLYCSSNQLTSLDISQNTVLEELSCSHNQLTSLDLSQSTVLWYLHCEYNQLTSLDLSRNTVLKTLYCSSNQLTSLDISQSTVLKTLYCEYNQLTSLDLSQNTDLEGLDCYNNKLTSLDLSQNTVLEYLFCQKNQLTSLDLSQNTVLMSLYCHVNQLTSLDIRGVRRADKRLSFFSNAPLQTLKVHQNTKDHQSIIDLKIARGNDVTISTYSASAGSTTYNLICNDYVPGAWSGGSCND